VENFNFAGLNLDPESTRTLELIAVSENEVIEGGERGLQMVGGEMEEMNVEERRACEISVREGIGADNEVIEGQQGDERRAIEIETIASADGTSAERNLPDEEVINIGQTQDIPPCREMNGDNERMEEGIKVVLDFLENVIDDSSVVIRGVIKWTRTWIEKGLVFGNRAPILGQIWRLCAFKSMWLLNPTCVWIQDIVKVLL
jgi:hypothetical protein